MNSGAKGFWGREIPLQLLILGSWLVGFGAAAVLEHEPNASLWFPPAAITFGAILVLGLRAVPTLWLACLFVTFINAQSAQTGLIWFEVLLAGLVFALTHTVAYGTLALALRSSAKHFTPITTFRKVSAFLLGGAAAAGAASLLGGVGLGLTGMAELSTSLKSTAPRWIGDYAGLITVTPLFVILLTRTAHFFEAPLPAALRQLLEPLPWQRSWPVALAKLTTLAVLTLGVLGIAIAIPDQEAVLFLLFLCLPLQLWIVYSENTRTSLGGMLMFSLLLALAAGLTRIGEQALMLQFVVISLAVSSYLGLAVPALYRDNHRMRQLLTHDSLTRALSRTFFEDGAREGLLQSEIRSQPACLVMVDLDNLKLINDQFGHAAGDAELTRLARICSAELEPGQLLGRLSGDEFALFLGECTRQKAQAVIDAVREKLADGPPRLQGLPATASFGIAEYMPGVNSADYDQLLVDADQSMYRQKRERSDSEPASTERRAVKT